MKNRDEQKELERALKAIGPVFKYREQDVEKQADETLPACRTTAPYNVPEQPLHPPFIHKKIGK